MPVAHPVYALAHYNLSGENVAPTESLPLNASKIPLPNIFTSQTADANPSSNQQNVALAIICIFPIMAFFLVSLRIYSRARVRQIWIDDILIGLAMLLMVPMTAGSYMFTKTSFLGIHLGDVPLDQLDLARAGRWNYLVQVFYHPILPLCKSAVLIFLLRLGGHRRPVRWAIHAVNSLNLAAMAATTLTAMLQCSPVRTNWAFSASSDGACNEQFEFYIAGAGIAIFTDVLVLALPFCIFLHLRISWHMKTAVLGVFLLGSIVTFVSIGRLWYLCTLYNMSMYPLPRDADLTYPITFVVSNVEANLAIICACAPALRGLARSWWPRLFRGSGEVVVAARDRNAAAVQPRPGPRKTTLDTTWSDLGGSEAERRVGSRAGEDEKVGEAHGVESGASDAAACSLALQAELRAIGGGGATVGMCYSAGNSSEVSIPGAVERKSAEAFGHAADPGMRTLEGTILCTTDITVEYEPTVSKRAGRLF
ncbi:hypothetical protein PpBr36_09084 [Pyricularia pennisetigena]|uniref:hypothetical protein n=1 Tax=Pyricularia pennisetigena TaxID=1578925 RepID=UPI00114E6A25|nr:hypothetical protein PpBr36_09084 [Pyricularia pennisetigena]TLS24517.1 hypothetical protein PpBr36_09084 [Pyricularia pennisetigena]